MTRPEIIRADSIDLQDQAAPSAQDHTRQPTNPAPLGLGPPAPHQAEALREVAAEVAEQHGRSPRVSKEWSSGEIQQMQSYGEDDLVAGVNAKLNSSNSQQQDDLAVAQNGGLTGSTAEDADMADAEGDDGMDDDMMDKISSSPSIDDGGYSLTSSWPLRSTSLSCSPASQLQPPQACSRNPPLSPVLVTPDRYPYQLRQRMIDVGDVECGQVNRNHHLQGEYSRGAMDENENKDEDLSNYEERIGEIGPASPMFVQQTSPYHEVHGDPFSDDTPETSPQKQLVIQIPGAPEYNETDDMMIPYESSEDDDFEIPYNTDSRYVDSGWGGECLRDTEDIDFEFVYALHTFVATVEGQANATKGDTMVLLDDSNSYWWLVRVVKDSSIGYLPAEHIETPTERLARLNKHRNIDLTSTMLGDQAEKSKNPLKKAMRRRNAKTVQFAAPTYVEASDIDYSSDEEDGEGDFYKPNGATEQVTTDQETVDEDDDVNTVEPLKPRAEIREVKSDPAESDGKTGDTVSNGNVDGRTSDEIFDSKPESKSRNGTVRNTDSFFRDDSVETRKITLTPNLLRDDSSTSTRTSNDSKEFSKRPSLDKLEKDSTSDKSKDKKDKRDKKEKDKKPGMLSGLFKRKEKKSKATDDEGDDTSTGKQSSDNPRGSPVPSKDSDEIAYTDENSQTSSVDVQRHPSKLQKQPPPEVSLSQKITSSKETKIIEQVQQAPAPERPPPAISAQAPSMRLVQSDTETNLQQPRPVESSPEKSRTLTPILTMPKEQKPTGTISKILRSASGSASEPKPIKAKKAKSRVELDDFDSTPERSPVDEPERAPSKQSRPIPGSFPDSYMTTRPDEGEDRLSESPVQVSPITELQSYPPPLVVDTSSQDEAPSPQSSPSPELVDVDEGQDKKGTGSSTTSRSTPTWSDSNLRTFFDDDGDIKDLLVVVYDKSGVVPAGPDHPVSGNLFRDENAKLADITNRLDGMLGDWLARKMRTQGSR